MLKSGEFQWMLNGNVVPLFKFYPYYPHIYKSIGMFMFMFMFMFFLLSLCAKPPIRITVLSFFLMRVSMGTQKFIAY